jgi:hypothetical protein
MTAGWRRELTMPTTPLPEPRYERKFVIPKGRLSDMVAMVRRHPALFHEVYPPRAVNNIYLDTPALADYRAHVNGTADRLKTRIRWYGALRGEASNPSLEQKLKHGLVGRKAVHPLPPLRVNGGVARSQLPILTRPRCLNCSAPSSITSNRRWSTATNAAISKARTVASA